MFEVGILACGPLLSMAFWYVGAARLNDTSSEEMSDSRLMIDSGRFLVIIGG